MPLMMSLHQGLGAEPDGDVDHAGSGDQRSDLDTHGGKDHEPGHDQEHDKENIAQDRQQRCAGAGGGALPRCRAARAAAPRRSCRRSGPRATRQMKSTIRTITTALTTPRIQAGRHGIAGGQGAMRSISQARMRNRAAASSDQKRKPRALQHSPQASAPRPSQRRFPQPQDD